MNIVIDIGNTATKVAVFKEDKLIWLWHADDVLNLSLFSKKNLNITHSIISSVVKTPENLNKFLSSKTRLIKFSHKTPLPFINRYKTPNTLGLDRIASVAGAQKRFPRKNVLVIDAGTCIKYDFINKKGEYLGGGISPGLNMRFNSLHNFTDRLPLIKPEKVKTLIGNSTASSILTGVILGIANEINGFITEYKNKHPQLKVILTGGDAEFLGAQLKSSIFAAPYLTLEGLKEILNYNVRYKKSN